MPSSAPEGEVILAAKSSFVTVSISTYRRQAYREGIAAGSDALFSFQNCFLPNSEEMDHRAAAAPIKNRELIESLAMADVSICTSFHSGLL